MSNDQIMETRGWPVPFADPLAARARARGGDERNRRQRQLQLEVERASDKDDPTDLTFVFIVCIDVSVCVKVCIASNVSDGTFWALCAMENALIRPKSLLDCANWNSPWWIWPKSKHSCSERHIL